MVKRDNFCCCVVLSAEDATTTTTVRFICFLHISCCALVCPLLSCVQCKCAVPNAARSCFPLWSAVAGCRCMSVHHAPSCFCVVGAGAVVYCCTAVLPSILDASTIILLLLLHTVAIDNI